MMKKNIQYTNETQEKTNEQKTNYRKEELCVFFLMGEGENSVIYLIFMDEVEHFNDLHVDKVYNVMEQNEIP